jgi:hypothetical protein
MDPHRIWAAAPGSRRGSERAQFSPAVVVVPSLEGRRRRERALVGRGDREHPICARNAPPRPDQTPRQSETAPRSHSFVQTMASSVGEGANEDTQLVTQAKDRPGSGRGNAQKPWSGWREPSLRSSPPTASSSRSRTGPRNHGCRMPNLQELRTSSCSRVRGSSVRMSLR